MSLRMTWTLSLPRTRRIRQLAIAQRLFPDIL